MAIRQSKQPFLVTRLNLDELNDAMRRIQDELDRLAGLRGPILLYDSEHYVDDYGQRIHGWGVKP
jgi:hypothetical protein